MLTEGKKKHFQISVCHILILIDGDSDWCREVMTLYFFQNSDKTKKTQAEIAEFVYVVPEGSEQEADHIKGQG